MLKKTMVATHGYKYLSHMTIGPQQLSIYTAGTATRFQVIGPWFPG